MSALNQPCHHRSKETLQGKAAFCTAHGQQKLRGMPTRAHRVPVGVKAVLCEPAAGAVGSWAQTRAHGMRNDGAALSSMQLRADGGMRQLTVRVSLLHLQHWTPAAGSMDSFAAVHSVAPDWSASHGEAFRACCWNLADSMQVDELVAKAVPAQPQSGKLSLLICAPKVHAIQCFS